MSQLSPPLPPPPISPQMQRHKLDTCSLPSPPPLPPHAYLLSPQKSIAASLLTNVTQANCNFNSFGRSNTLDRKPKQSNFNFNKENTVNQINSQHFYNSLERKTLTDNETSNYRLFNGLKPQQFQVNTSPQRNSLNLTLKPPSPQSPSQRASQSNGGPFSKRPLSQDTILENASSLLEFQQRISSTPTSPEHYSSLISGANLKLDLENAKNQIFLLTNQLNTSVSWCLFILDNHKFN